MAVTTPNMGLVVPAIGVETGPTWAADLNASLSIVDSHNHSNGQGVQITPNGININADLSFGVNNAVSLRSTRFSAQGVSLSGVSDVGCLYVVGNELYYNDVTGGHQIAITSSGSVNAGAGSISGLPSGTASASYSAGTFVWRSATSTAANMDAGSYVFRNAGASSNGLTLQAPNLSGGSTTLTLPSVPGSLSLMALDASGNMSAPYSIAGGLSGSVLTAGSVTGTQIASQTVAQNNLATRATGTTVAAGGIAVSASCGNFTTTNTTLTPVTNLSVTITTTGRPVMLMLVSDGSVNPCYFSNNNSPGAQGIWQILRGATSIATHVFEGANGTVVIPGLLQAVDIVAAGTYTYTIQGQVGAGGSVIALRYAQLLAYEL